MKLINYEGVIILSTGETPWGNFRGKSSWLVFMLFAYFYLHHVLDKIPMWKLFTLITLIEKSKAEKCPWVKKRKKKPLRTFTSENVAYDFGRNTSTLTEFIGYADSADCREISPEHSRDNDKQKCVGKF